MNRKTIIQSVLFLIGISAAISCAALGAHEPSYHIGQNIDYGLDGGAIGMGIIAAGCFIGITLLETQSDKNTN